MQDVVGCNPDRRSDRRHEAVGCLGPHMIREPLSNAVNLDAGDDPSPAFKIPVEARVDLLCAQ
jgi:hypothetical protein